MIWLKDTCASTISAPSCLPAVTSRNLDYHFQSRLTGWVNFLTSSIFKVRPVLEATVVDFTRDITCVKGLRKINQPDRKPHLTQLTLVTT
jgi:hypothetical protein